jgi:hypothetical protein
VGDDVEYRYREDGADGCAEEENFGFHFFVCVGGFRR